MRTLPLLLAVFLTGCGTTLTVKFPPVPAELKQPCGSPIFNPLTTADQYDLAARLGEAKEYGKTCSARMERLIDAVQAREALAVEVTR